MKGADKKNENVITKINYRCIFYEMYIICAVLLIRKCSNRVEVNESKSAKCM